MILSSDTTNVTEYKYNTIQVLANSLKTANYVRHRLFLPHSIKCCYKIFAVFDIYNNCSNVNNTDCTNELEIPIWYICIYFYMNELMMFHNYKTGTRRWT